MQTNSLDIKGSTHHEQGDQWRQFLCNMLHIVDVETPNLKNFSAYITAKRHGDISCARFWSNPHTVTSGRETYGNSGRSGYLLSWQMEGRARIIQDGEEMNLMPGSITIVDGRRPMKVVFSENVRRIVTKIPAPMLEHRIPGLIKRHHYSFQNSGAFSDMLFASLRELADESSLLDGAEVDLLSENICNLLRFNVSRSGIALCDDKELRRQAIVRFLKRNACDPEITVDKVASHLNISRRLVQKILAGMDTNFTDFIISERLESAVAKLSTLPDLSISNVAYKSGFNDVSHFNHLFRRKYGMTPSEARNRN